MPIAISRKAGAVLAIALLSRWVGCAHTGEVRGRVVDRHGVPIADARVTIEETGESAQTDSSGDYHFSGLPGGSYVVRAVERDHGLSAIADITVAAGATTTRDLIVTAPTSHALPPPGYPPRPGDASPDSLLAAAPPVDSPYCRVVVFYGTDRKPASTGYFGPERDSLTFGEAVVTIPKSHRPGQLETPRWYRLLFHEDPRRDIMLIGVRPLAPGSWTDSLDRALGATARREVLLFIHGYNVTFADAARRTAQLAYDLSFEGVNGVPAFYSWPSHGTLIGYPADEAVTDRTIPNLVAFLRHFIDSSNVARVHIIAHSMGSKILAGSLAQLTPAERGRIGQVVFTAPDIDAEVFAEQIVPALAPEYPHLSMYSSSRDNALVASATYHAAPRAGMSGANLVVVRGLETIDASRIDTDLLGHAYFADNKEVIDDLFMLVNDNLPAANRNLRPDSLRGMEFWRLP